MKHQPVIIEAEHSEGDNEMSFAIRGSVEWLDTMMPFLMFSMGALTAQIWEEADEAERQELIKGINALRRRESYQGKLLTITIAKEKTNHD